MINGRRKVLFYGRTATVRVFIFFPTLTTHNLWFCSGIWQDHTLVGDAFNRLCRRSLHTLMISSSIIEDIKLKCATGLDSFAYYYFDFSDIRKQDRRGLLSSLLMQLCTRSHRGYDILSKLFVASANGLRQPSEFDLIQCLKKVFEPRRGTVYIIVDAVDESPTTGMPSPREKVLELIKELVDLRHPNLRFCITSRPEVDIQTVFGRLPLSNVSLDDQAGQKGDIDKYIESVVESDPNMQRWTPEDRKLVISSLSKKAKGM